MNQEQIIQEIKKLAQTWAAAEMHGDTSFIEQVLTDDFLGVGPLGFLLTKQDWVDRHLSRDLLYTAFDLHEMAVRAYQDAAILVGRLAQQGTYRDTPITAQFRTTLVWVARHEHWQLASYHVSAIGRPPSFAQTTPTPSPRERV